MTHVVDTFVADTWPILAVLVPLLLLIGERRGAAALVVAWLCCVAALSRRFT